MEADRTFHTAFFLEGGEGLQSWEFVFRMIPFRVWGFGISDGTVATFSTSESKSVGPQFYSKALLPVMPEAAAKPSPHPDTGVFENSGYLVLGSV